MAEERTGASPGGGAAATQVDVAQLAERVYRLMLAELRLERARSAGSPPQRG